MNSERFRILGLTALIVAIGFVALSSPAVAAAVSDHVALPADVVPEHYDIAITPDATQLSFKGSVRIDVRVLQPTHTIVLNAADLVFEHVTLSGRTQAPHVTFDDHQQTATIAFTETIPAGNYVLSIDYRGRIYQQASGLFALDYSAANGGKGRALFTQFENSDARRFIPSWDEPERKATFTLSATVPADQMAVSNMPVQSSEDAGNGRKRVHFQRTPKMSSYLLFFAQGDFERVARKVGQVDVGVIVKRGDTTKAAFALETAAQLLPYYDDYFGTPFPLPKLDLIAGPGSSQFFGAMENWGAIFYFDHDLLLDPRISTEQDRQGVYIVVAHEMAHQWFGDLVTMAWWDNLWLNEGFASWMENKAADHFHPEWHVWLKALGSQEEAMQVDAAQGTHPIVTPIPDVFAATNAFDTITYQKGGAVIRMLESYVGEAAFRDGVRRYMKAHAYGNTVSDDLWREIDSGSDRKVTAIAHDFTLQPGVPLVSLQSKRCDGNRATLELSQSRFAVDDSGKGPAQVWRTPVEIQSLSAANVNTHALVSGSASTPVVIPACGPVLVNAGQTAYFRTRYKSEAFTELANRYGHLAPADQLGLLNDTAALAYTGDTPLANLQKIAASLPADADPVVWSALAGQLLEIDRLYHGGEAQKAFRVYARGVLQPLLTKLGWDAHPGEPDNVAIVRSTLLFAMGRFTDPAVVAEARRRFAELRKSPDSIPAAVRNTVLEIVGENADAATWEALHSLARTASSVLERLQYYGALAAVQDAGLAQKALDLALSEEPPITLRPQIIARVSRHHPDLAVSFAIAHWKTIGPMLESGSMHQFVPRLAQSGSDLALVDKLNAFAKENIPETARNALDKTVARIRYNSRVAQRLASYRWRG